MAKLKIYFFIFKKVCKKCVYVCVYIGIYTHISLEQQRKTIKESGYQWQQVFHCMLVILKPYCTVIQLSLVLRLDCHELRLQKACSVVDT